MSKRSRWLTSWAAAAVLCAGGAGIADAGTADGGARRALLVGIDRYAPPDPPVGQSPRSSGRRHWKNLQGAVNDVRGLRDVLIHRAGFKPEDVVVLEDEAATRQAILSTFQRHLIDAAAPGDHSFFFYAGHGSRIRNSRSKELDGRDETIVPADANIHAGDPVVIEIRDKEWDRLFTKVLDRGAWLTALFDSCHSGSISRSAAPVSTASRFLAEDERDVARLIGPDPTERPLGQEPEARDGALIISAAQEDQEAKETVLITGEKKEWHGAFTLALIQSMNEVSPVTPADRLFERVTARLLAAGYQQEPVLAGRASRRHAPFFGGALSAGRGRLTVNVIQAYAADDLELQGGAAVGLTKDTELARLSGGPELRIKVSEVRGLSRSRAQVVKGDWRAVRAGDEFEVVTWGLAPSRPLSVWLPPPRADQRPLQQMGEELVKAAAARNVRLIDDPGQSSPTHLLAWRDDQWWLWPQAMAPRALGKFPRAEDVLEQLKSDSAAPSLFLSWPPSEQVANELDLHHHPIPGVVSAATPEEADYVLTGRLAGPRIEYAWLSARGAVALPPKRRLVPLPARSLWSVVPGGPDPCDAGGLRDCLGRLAKLHYWLTLESRPDDGRFPYRLAFKRLSDQTVVDRGDLLEGTYRLVLRADPGQIQQIQREWGLQSRYIYVFVIDQEGRTTQLFPNAQSLEREHLLPATWDVKKPAHALAEVPLGESGLVTIHAPYGMDTYLVITSAQAIPHLADLIEAGPVSERLPEMRGESDWSIDRLTLRSIASASRGGRRRTD